MSAYSGTQRPAFERLLADCRAGRIELVIVHHVARLSRMDPIEAIPLVTELLNLGITIVSVIEGEFRKGNATGLFHLIMRLDQAHNESKLKSIAIKGANEIARSLGGFIGGKAPYGFRVIRENRVNPADGRPVAINLLTLDPAEARVIRDAAAELMSPSPVEHQAKRAGQQQRPGTLGFVCRQLNVNGTPTRGATTGKLTADSSWAPRTLERIMRDPRTAGYSAEVLYKRDDHGRSTRSIQGYEILRDGQTGVPIVAHPAILGPDAFWAVQRILNGQPTVSRSRPTPSLLASTGLLFCECGSPMKSNSNSAVTAKSSYRCSRPAGRTLPGQHALDCTISKNALEGYVGRHLFALIAAAAASDGSGEVLHEAIRLFNLASMTPESAALSHKIQADLTDAKRQLSQLNNEHGKSCRRSPQQTRILSARIEAMAQQLAAIHPDPAPTLPIKVWLGEPGADPLGPGSWWRNAAIGERRAMLSLFIRRITISKSPSGHTRPPVESRVRIAWIAGDNQHRGSRG